MGETMPIYFKWFQNSQPVGEPFEVVLNDGDMYIMSEKAVGFDWLKKKIPTLRHSTGCSKFTGIKLGIEIEIEQHKMAEQHQKKALLEDMKAEKEKNKVLAKQKREIEKQQKKALLEDMKAEKEKNKALAKQQKEAL
jgi:hypothetical protein